MDESHRRLRLALPHLQAVLTRLLAQPLRAPADLVEAVRVHVAEVEQLAAGGQEFIDLDTARQVADRCVWMLGQLGPQSSPQERALVQLAAEYFLEEDDAEGDIDSPIGFDDDAEVVALVAAELGWTGRLP